MESYKKELLEEKYGKLINLKTFNDTVLKEHKHEKYKLAPAMRRLIADIIDEEGLILAYEAKYGLCQHYNKLFIAGTTDFPQDHIDDLKLQFDDTLNKTKRGRDADAYYRSHHEIDTTIGHSLGGAVALSLEQHYEKEGNNPYGIIKSKTFGAPAVSGNIKSPKLKYIIKNEIVSAGTAGMGYIGASADAAIGFADGGLLTGMGVDIGKRTWYRYV